MAQRIGAALEAEEARKAAEAKKDKDDQAKQPTATESKARDSADKSRK